MLADPWFLRERTAELQSIRSQWAGAAHYATESHDASLEMCDVATKIAPTIV